MQVELSKRLKAATVIETVMAMLILMISVSAGLMIYGRLTATGVNDRALRADLAMTLVADSIAAGGGFSDEVVQRDGFTVEMKFTEDARFRGAWVMTAVCRDKEGGIIAESKKMVSGNGKAD